MKKGKCCGTLNDDAVVACSKHGGRAFEEARDLEGIRLTGRLSLLVLFLSLIYLISPWDVLTFSLFDGLAIVSTTIGIFALIVIGKEREVRV